MNVLLIMNDPPYGTERSSSGLRLALSLARRDDVELRVFLIGDAASCAMVGQKTPEGYYDLERMIGSVARRGGDVACCGTCLDARGITEDLIAKGARRSGMDELTEWTCGRTGSCRSERRRCRWPTTWSSWVEGPEDWSPPGSSAGDSAGSIGAAG